WKRTRRGPSRRDRLGARLSRPPVCCWGWDSAASSTESCCIRFFSGTTCSRARAAIPPPLSEDSRSTPSGTASFMARPGSPRSSACSSWRARWRTASRGRSGCSLASSSPAGARSTWSRASSTITSSASTTSRPTSPSSTSRSWRSAPSCSSVDWLWRGRVSAIQTHASSG
ncbi:MAG: FIG00817429: hypothetical protein, partial [uncultured Solirubrobacterales bacterium]